MTFTDQTLPALSDTLVPPIVRGIADLTTFAYHGNDYEALMNRIATSSTNAAQTYDSSIAAQLSFRRAEGLNLQDAALELSQIYRIHAPVNQDQPPQNKPRSQNNNLLP